MNREDLEAPVWHRITRSEKETEIVGRRLAEVLVPGTLLLLNGVLGAGKTVLARGVVWGLGVKDPYVTSPTFTLMNPYPQGRLPVYHFDLYRLGSPDELTVTGTDEYLEGDGVALVEWASRGGEWIPEDRLVVDLFHLDDTPECRRIEVRASGPRSREVLDAFRRHGFD